MVIIIYMDYSDYSNRQQPDKYRDRDRDRYQTSPQRARRDPPYRELSPVRPRQPRDVHVERVAREQFDRYVPRQDELKFRDRELPRRITPPPLAPRVKKPLLTSAPGRLFRVNTTPAEKRLRSLPEEMKFFEENQGGFHNFNVEEYNAQIELQKNFAVAEKYFEAMKEDGLKPNAETYQLMIKSAVNEDKFERATELAAEAKDILDLKVFCDRQIENYLRSNQPMKACKVVKLAGVDSIGTFLKVAEEVKPPPFVFAKILRVCRHKGERPANLPAAEAILGFVNRNQIGHLVGNEFYVFLTDIYYERNHLAQAEYFLKFVHYDVKIQDGLPAIDMHGITPRVGLMILQEYLKVKSYNRDFRDFCVITGKGIHSSEDAKFKHSFREFIIYNQNVISPIWKSYVPDHNSGVLIFRYSPNV